MTSRIPTPSVKENNMVKMVKKAPAKTKMPQNRKNKKGMPGKIKKAC